MAARKRTKTAPKTVQVAERAAKALDLRKQGYTYREIGSRLRISFTRAHQLVQQSLSELRQHTAETAEDVRDQQLARLDSSLKALWPKVKKGDPRAIETALRVEERRAKLLGLDAANKHEVAGPDGGAIPIEDARAMLAARLAAVVGAPVSGATDEGAGGNSS